MNAIASRRQLWLIGVGYLLFVVYGSLVPLRYQAMPIDDAIAAFSRIPWLQLGIGSRADWVANLLLFIPLAFLFIGAMASGRGLLIRIMVSVLVLVLGVSLSIGIEFTQLYFPQRTVSQNDIAAESLGTLLGISAWWLVGARFLTWHSSWLGIAETTDLTERIAWVYLAIVLAYNVLPLDLTISAVEIFHKWREGKVVLIPFSDLPADPAFAIYEIVTDVLLWVPLTFLWRYRGTRSTEKVWRMGFAYVFALELMQLFVYSRVSDVTDLLTGAMGCWVGARIGMRLGKSGSGPEFGRVSGFLPLALSIAWLMVLLVLFWYPFNFLTDGAYIRERAVFLEHVPFEVYYFGTEYRAITEVFHKILSFAPLGGGLAWWVGGLSWKWRDLAGFLSFFVLGAVAMAVELGQMMLPERIPDTTDAALEWLGGVLGYLLIRLAWRRINRPLAKVPRMSAPSGGEKRPYA